MKTSIHVLLLSLLIVGCNSNSSIGDSRDREPNREAGKYEYQLYGKLEKLNDGYSFTEFSELYEGSDPWVRLSDLRPMWNVHDEDCLAGVDVAGLNRQCSSEDERLFRVSQVDFTPKKSAGYAVLSVFTLGMGLASPPAAVKFDREKFGEAVKQAEEKLNSLGKAFGYNYRDVLRDYNSEKVEFDRIYENKTKSYKVNAVPNIKLIDQSGLFDKNSRDFENHISVKKNILTQSNRVKALGAKEISNLLYLVKNQNKLLLADLGDSVSTLNVSCTEGVYLYADYQLKCPKQISASMDAFDVQVFVKAMSYQNVLPRSFLAEDEQVSIYLKDGKFIISNKSKNYITIDSLSFYHNGKIATLAELDHELAPFSKSTQHSAISVQNLSLDKKAIYFSGVTQDIAKNTDVEYGIAAKYRIINMDKENTLFRSQTFTLLELI
ncbi:hypothetical protein [Alkalimarinus coralli]|uniref:hypothetical protein n=1 Tax=Alkalimarinus coralli TaxID=2935863 RepID=UPI00202B17B0|nr:hypothetical protein [Alkalimarinus coralli]